MNDLEEFYSGCKSSRDYSKKYMAFLSNLFSDIDLDSIEKVIKLFWDAREYEKTIFFIGNGGSAATCSHFSEDLSLGAFVGGKKPFKTISLTDNTPFITAIGNDIGFDNVFIGQLRCLLKKGDLVVGISGSGNSPNLIKAIEYANKYGAVTIGMLGFDGGKMKNLCQHNIIIKTKKGMYGPVEDFHLILEHIISTYLMFKVKNEEI